MRVLVIGGGGREHALALSIAKSPRVNKVFCAPGNPGMEEFAECVSINVGDIQGLLSFAHDKSIDLTIVGPEAPLADGISDKFRQARLSIFGPSQMAARIETSKVFAKRLMAQCKIPTPMAATFSDSNLAREYVRTRAFPVVIKADGLAQGKGVFIVTTLNEAESAIKELLEKKVFGASGATVIIEDFVDGNELSVMALTDGNTVAPLLASRDYKRIFDNDHGPNTGGMGSFAPVPSVDSSLMTKIVEQILQPIVDGLSSLGSPYRGLLYAGIMLTADGPRVLEFNARFGDPETQVVLSLLKTDLIDLLDAVVTHRLDAIPPIEWHEGAAVCVVLASKGYPGTSDLGKIVSGLDIEKPDGSTVFHAGTRSIGENVVTAGGRVFGVTARGNNHETARRSAYEAVSQITFDGMQYRKDICTGGV